MSRGAAGGLLESSRFQERTQGRGDVRFVIVFWRHLVIVNLQTFTLRFKSNVRYYLFPESSLTVHREYFALSSAETMPTSFQNHNNSGLEDPELCLGAPRVASWKPVGSSSAPRGGGTQDL